MEKIPKVSVCIPVYNCERYIGEAIDSVLRQTFTDFELIIVDNHSNDATPEIIKKYAQQDARIIHCRNERNLGLVGNWNRAVLRARGEYIKLLCADDVIEPEHLQAFAKALDENPNVSLVTSYEQLIGDRCDVRNLPDLPATGELDGRLMQKHLLKSGNWVGSPSSVMFRKRDLHIGLFSGYWGWVVDFDMWMRLLSIGNLFVIPRILTHNRVHNQRASAVNDVDYFFIKEELIFLKIAFQFPQIYGSYSKNEQKSMYSALLGRLIGDGLGRRDLRSLSMMVKIGAGYGWMRFCGLLAKGFLRKITHNKITRKIKQSISRGIISRK